LTVVVKAVQALQYLIRDPFGRDINTDLLQRAHRPQTTCQHPSTRWNEV